MIHQIYYEQYLKLKLSWWKMKTTIFLFYILLWIYINNEYYC